MKIRCNRESLLSAYQMAAAVAPARSPKPILQNVKLEASAEDAKLLATDLEIGIRIEVPGVETEAAGAAILPLGRFGAILRECSDVSLTIESDDQGTVVQGERSRFKLPAQDPAEFPSIAEFDVEKFHEVPARLMK
ncbi:MAG: DNA polymerase III subunit beta, partial [Planctomycetales bacterium]|nr:DNA polymerase III subunit beta [Planctomycetales bacterium]